MMREALLSLPRRATILGLTSLVSLGRTSLAVASAPTEKRFVVVILRGAMDGLSAVVPYGDPGLAALRPELVPPPPGQDKGLLDLGGKFGLHPAMTRSLALYRANELAIVHAVAGNYRVRSHFEAQDNLESGADHRMTSGWLNRAVAAMPASAKQGTDASSCAIAIGATVPLLLRGGQPVANWAPHGFAEPQLSLYQAILALNEGDPITGPAITAGLRDRGFGDQVMGHDQAGRNPPSDRDQAMDRDMDMSSEEARIRVTAGDQTRGRDQAMEANPFRQGQDPAKGGARNGGRFAFPALATAAGDLLRAPDGPRIAALDLGGWDTHTAQNNRLTQPLTQLDTGLDALKTALGDAWRHTVVMVMTEFGRTARMNGTKGTDHGTATVSFVAGGAVSGGRVLANWPGLGRGQLFEDRDLAPTTDLRSVATGILTAHLGLDQSAMAIVFPGSGPVQPTRGLVRST
jgi:uncharacterized protein (DUF1501 family)